MWAHRRAFIIKMYYNCQKTYWKNWTFDKQFEENIGLFQHSLSFQVDRERWPINQKSIPSKLTPFRCNNKSENVICRSKNMQSSIMLYNVWLSLINHAAHLNHKKSGCSLCLWPLLDMFHSTDWQSLHGDDLTWVNENMLFVFPSLLVIKEI